MVPERLSIPSPFRPRPVLYPSDGLSIEMQKGPASFLVEPLNRWCGLEAPNREFQCGVCIIPKVLRYPIAPPVGAPGKL